MSDLFGNHIVGFLMRWLIWFKQYLFRIKYLGKYIQCHVRQDLTLSIKLLSKSFRGSFVNVFS